MGPHFHVCNFRSDFWHMAGDAATSRRSCFVMRVLFDCPGARAVQRKRSMAIEAKFVRRFSQLRVVVRAMRIVAAEACDTATVHHALHEIISLHAILVSGAVRIMGEGRVAERMFL